jgi:hypothetical protein
MDFVHNMIMIILVVDFSDGSKHNDGSIGYVPSVYLLHNHSKYSRRD